MIATILNFFFPKRCVGCQQTGNYLCARCVALIPPAEPLDTPDVLACFTYHDERIKRLLWLFKYKQTRSIASDLAPVLYDRILEEVADNHTFFPSEEKILLVPVPLSPRRLRERGFNQAAELARELAKLNPALFQLEAKIISKIRETHTQVSVKDRARRLKNVKGAFRLDQAEPLKGRTAVVIDDVLTTGGTIEEVRKTLRAGQPRRVFGLVIAHG